MCVINNMDLEKSIFEINTINSSVSKFLKFYYILEDLVGF